MEVVIEQAATGYEGIILVRSVPPELNTDAKVYAYWKTLKMRERDRYTTHEYRNLITTAGLLAINNFLGNTTTIAGFAKYLALGTGALAGPAVGDTLLVNERFRKAPGVLTVTGNTTDVTVSLLSTDAQFVLTEAGLFTGAATGTANSGTLSTHLLFGLDNTGGIARSIDYLIVRN